MCAFLPCCLPAPPAPFLHLVVSPVVQALAGPLAVHWLTQAGGHSLSHQLSHALGGGGVLTGDQLAVSHWVIEGGVGWG